MPTRMTIAGVLLLRVAAMAPGRAWAADVLYVKAAHVIVDASQRRSTPARS